MSDLGVITTNLYCASKLLKAYLSATSAIKSRGGYVEGPDETRGLLDVLAPLSLHLRGMSYFALGVHCEEMFGFLRRRHREGWPGVRDSILSIASRLEGGGGGTALSAADLSILDDVSDALDNECASLYMEMRGRCVRRAWGAWYASRLVGPRRWETRSPDHVSLVRLATACSDMLEEESRLLGQAGAPLDASDASDAAAADCGPAGNIPERAGARLGGIPPAPRGAAGPPRMPNSDPADASG